MRTDAGKREHPHESTSTAEGAALWSPIGYWGVMRRAVGGGMTYKHVYQPGTPWHRDIPALKCPPPPSLQEAESRPRRGPKLRVREGHTWGKGATEGGMSGGSPLRHDVYKLGIPL